MASGLTGLCDSKEGLVVMLSLLFCLVPSSGAGQTRVSGSANVLVSIVQPVSITSSSGNDGAGDLNFGLAIVNTTASIDPHTSSSASLFTISAGADMPMTASFSSPAVTLTDSLGNKLSFSLLAVGAQVSSSQQTAAQLTSGGTITMSGSGVYYVWIGGTVAVPSSAAGGTYTGYFHLTVAYQ